MNGKSILVLARRDHTEAMRVAAGLTIVGNDVRLILMTGPVAETDANAAQAELLDLSDITPETTVTEMADELHFLDAVALGQAIVESDRVVSL
ncbi:MAG TPA: hypothetical protein ENI69_01100 [Rhodospirillales bacterium]|nr:hypothetical protein [Rhodospirillales bacterium]